MSMTFAESYTDDDKALVILINTWLQESGKTGAELSRLTEIKEGTRSSILNGNYVSSPSAFLQKMKEAMDNANARNESAKIDIPFIETSIAETIDQVCKRANVDRDFGIFVGAVGVGKTTALRRYVEKYKSAVLIEAFDGIDHSTFISELIGAVGATKIKGNTSLQINNLIKTLKGTNRVLLVDEANSLPRASFGALRRISDIAGVGVVLVGATELLPLVQDPAGRFGQISSRIGFWPTQVSRITEKDCALLAGSYFSAPQPEPIVKAFYSCSEGSARTLRNLLKNTYRYALKNKQEITPDLIRNINANTMAGRGYVTGGM